MSEINKNKHSTEIENAERRGKIFLRRLTLIIGFICWFIINLVTGALTWFLAPTSQQLSRWYSNGKLENFSDGVYYSVIFFGPIIIFIIYLLGRRDSR